MRKQFSVYNGDTSVIPGPSTFWVVVVLVSMVIVAYFQHSKPVTSYKNGVRYVYYEDTNTLIATHLDTGEQYIYSPKGVEKVQDPRD